MQVELPHLPPSLIKHVTSEVPAFSLPPRRSTVLGTRAEERASVYQPARARQTQVAAERARAVSAVLRKRSSDGGPNGDDAFDNAIRAAAHATGA